MDIIVKAKNKDNLIEVELLLFAANFVLDSLFNHSSYG